MNIMLGHIIDLHHYNENDYGPEQELEAAEKRL